MNDNVKVGVTRLRFFFLSRVDSVQSCFVSLQSLREELNDYTHVSMGKKHFAFTRVATHSLLELTVSLCFLLV